MGRPLLTAIIWVLTFGIVAFVGQVVFASDTHFDFRIYRDAARALSSGADPYAVCRLQEDTLGAERSYCYLYPPLLAAALSFFQGMAPHIVEFGWVCLSSAGLCFAAATIRRLDLLRVPGALLALLLIFWPPVVEVFAEGQVNLVVLGALALLYYGLDRSSGSAVAVGFAIAAHLKATPLLLGLVFANRAYRNQIPVLVSVVLALMLFIVMVFGWSPWTQFLSASLQVVHNEDLWANWQNATAAKLIATFGVTRQRSFEIQLVLAAILWVVTLRSFIRATAVDAHVAASAGICLMILISPVTWYHHVVWLLFPLASAWQGSRGTIVERLVVGMSAGVMTGALFANRIAELDAPSAVLLSVCIMGPTLVLWWLLVRRLRSYGVVREA